MSSTVADAVGQRMQGGRVGRGKAFIAALIVGFVAFLATYKILRSGADD